LQGSANSQAEDETATGAENHPLVGITDQDTHHQSDETSQYEPER
jgi:hypothetical protein